MPDDRRKFFFRVSDDVDVLVAVLENPTWKLGYGNIRLGWEDIQRKLGKPVTWRSIRDRYNLLLKRYRNKNLVESRRSGSEDDYRERERLLHELSNRESVPAVDEEEEEESSAAPKGRAPFSSPSESHASGHLSMEPPSIPPPPPPPSPAVSSTTTSSSFSCFSPPPAPSRAQQPPVSGSHLLTATPPSPSVLTSSVHRPISSLSPPESSRRERDLARSSHDNSLDLNGNTAQYSISDLLMTLRQVEDNHRAEIELQGELRNRDQQLEERRLRLEENRLTIEAERNKEEQHQRHAQHQLLMDQSQQILRMMSMLLEVRMQGSGGGGGGGSDRNS